MDMPITDVSSTEELDKTERSQPTRSSSRLRSLPTQAPSAGSTSSRATQCWSVRVNRRAGDDAVSHGGHKYGKQLAARRCLGADAARSSTQGGPGLVLE